MKSLLVATHNPGKLNDIKKGLETLKKKGVIILSLNDLNIKDEPEETGKTFQENALLKARYYANVSGLPTLADDGGLRIEILNGEPGVKSRRWPGFAATDEELISYTLEKLKGVPIEKRKAILMTCLSFYDPSSKTDILECEENHGVIAEKASPTRIKGYPYRSLFIIEKFNKYYYDLTEEEHVKTNHRLIAVKRISEKLGKYLLQ